MYIRLILRFTYAKFIHPDTSRLVMYVSISRMTSRDTYISVATVPKFLVTFRFLSHNQKLTESKS